MKWLAVIVLSSGTMLIPITASSQEPQELVLTLPRTSWSWLEPSPKQDSVGDVLSFANLRNNQSAEKFWGGIRAQAKRLVGNWSDDVEKYIGADIVLQLTSIKISKTIGDEGHNLHPYLILNPKSLLGGNFNPQIGFRHVYHYNTLSIQHGAYIVYPNGVYSLGLSWAATKTITISVPFDLQVPNVFSPKPVFSIGFTITAKLY